MVDKDLKKNFVFNSLGAFIYSFTSLFYMIIATRIVGTDEAGLFTFAFSTANLLQVIGVYAGRTYQVTETNDSITDSDYYYNRLISCIFMVIFGLSFCFIKGYTLLKIAIIMVLVLYKMIDAYAEHYYAIIQKGGKLYKVGISLTIKGMLGIIVFLALNLLTKNILFSCIGLFITNLIVTFLYDYINAKYEKQVISKFDLKRLSLIYKCGIWIFLQTFLIQYILNASKYSIDKFLDNDFQTIFGIVIMPASLMTLVSQFIVQPYLVSIKDLIKDKKYKSLNKLMFKLCMFIFIIGLVGVLLTYFFGTKVLGFVYNIDLNNYRLELLIIVIASIFYAISFVINNVLIAFRKTFAPALCYLIVAIVELIIVDFLVNNYKLFGATLAYFIAMLLIVIIYLFIYITVIRKENNNG